jgi:hypothetical protein
MKCIVIVSFDDVRLRRAQAQGVSIVMPAAPTSLRLSAPLSVAASSQMLMALAMSMP